MTATERLRELLDERGVEWETDRSGFRVMWGRPVDEFHDTMEFKAVDNALPNGGLNVHICGATPEQAIAATLGADASPTQAESSGTLTAEKVRELMEENSRQYQSPTDPYVWLTEYDWQAIADELNATLGRGTCHDLAETPAYRDKTEFKCSECGYEYSAVGGFGCDSGDEPDFNFCPNCGRRVEVVE